MILETERLILRRFTPEDWRDLYGYLSQKAVVKYEPYDVYDEESAKQEATNRSNNEAFWAICLKDCQKLIGNVYFERQQPEQFGTWELGYVFNVDYQGKGYATESCRKILEFGFEERMARRIVAMCNPENVPSWKLLEKLKMRREGHLRKNIYFKCNEEGNPMWNDTYEYALLKEDWDQLK